MCGRDDDDDAIIAFSWENVKQIMLGKDMSKMTSKEVRHALEDKWGLARDAFLYRKKEIASLIDVCVADMRASGEYYSTGDIAVRLPPSPPPRDNRRR